jgi:alcohol dehydrogenase class IV
MQFEFATAGRILFGLGVSSQAPTVVAEFGARALVVTGGSPGRSGIVLESAAQFIVECEPTVAMAEAGAQLARERGCDVVVGIGGGSVLDAAKAIAALAANPGPALNYLEVIGQGQPLLHAALPVVAIPTTAGTGSEVTRNAVLAAPECGLKVSLRSPSMLPKVALVDPALAVSLPPATTAATGLDALTQLIEPYVSARATPLTDALCRDGIPRIVAALPRVFGSPADMEGRVLMALGALFSGMALANAGLGAVHGFAAVLGGQFTAPHGALCATLLPAVLRGNVQALRDRDAAGAALERYRDVARWIGAEPDATAECAADAAERLVSQFRIPRLAEWGVRSTDVAEVARKAQQASSMKANPVKLTSSELEQILMAAL